MSEQRKSWELDQIAKSEFFHQKLHEWGLLRIAKDLEEIRGEDLDWDLKTLNISQSAWNKIIHRGIKPVRVFTHPLILSTIVQATSYYRMLSMVSQKSMKRIGIDIDRYEQSEQLPDFSKSERIAKVLNHIISLLVDADEIIEPREFDIWRGMAAGTQAQGSWQNAKGDRAEILIKGMLRHRLETKEWLIEEALNTEQNHFQMKDERSLVFGDEPDIAVYAGNLITAAVEVKGGIDVAGVLERVGAALKSLHRAKEENANAVTILLMQAVSVSSTAQKDLISNQATVNYWFTIEEILEDEDKREIFFKLLNL